MPSKRLTEESKKRFREEVVVPSPYYSNEPRILRFLTDLIPIKNPKYVLIRGHMLTIYIVTNRKKATNKREIILPVKMRSLSTVQWFKDNFGKEGIWQ